MSVNPLLAYRISSIRTGNMFPAERALNANSARNVRLSDRSGRHMINCLHRHRRTDDFVAENLRLVRRRVVGDEAEQRDYCEGHRDLQSNESQLKQISSR